MDHKSAIDAAYAALMRNVANHDTPYKQDVEMAIVAYCAARDATIVPINATPEMLKAGEEWSGLPSATWTGMLDSAPDILGERLYG